MKTNSAPARRRLASPDPAEATLPCSCLRSPGRARAPRHRDRGEERGLDPQKLLDGDAEEWERALQRARELARRRCSGVEGVDHEDVAQDACARFLSELRGGGVGVTDASPYLSRIVVTIAIDARRRETTRRSYEILGAESAAAAIADPTDAGLHELMACPKLKEKLGLTLRTLDGALLRRWCGGERLEDLCASTGLPRTNVHRHIHGALRALAQFVEDDAAAA